MDIRRRVPQFVVYAIENAAEIFPTGLQHPIQPTPKFRRENLTRICGAHGRNLVATADGGFEIRHLAVELDAAVGEKLFGYADGRQYLPWKIPLKRQIVDREYGGRL